MKRRFLLLATLALVLCAGCQNKKKAPEGEAVAYQIFKAIWEQDGETFDQPCPEDCTVEFSNEFDEQEGFYAEQAVYCYPLKDGGWLGIYKTVDAAEGSGGFYSYKAYTWKDGVLTQVQNILPIPALDDLLSSEAMAQHPEATARLRALYEAHPEEFLIYDLFPKEQNILAELHPLDLEASESAGHWEESFWDLRVIYEAFPQYHWTGESFEK